MLTTDESHFSPEYRAVLKPGVHAWRAVSLQMERPYVVVSYAIKEDRAWLSQTSILFLDKDVLDFCRDVKADKLRRIDEVSLILPVTKGRRRGRRWVEVREILAGPSAETNGDAAVYVTIDGECITWPFVNKTIDRARTRCQRVYVARKDGAGAASSGPLQTL
jgi:hypothetical protein